MGIRQGLKERALNDYDRLIQRPGWIKKKEKRLQENHVSVKGFRFHVKMARLGHPIKVGIDRSRRSMPYITFLNVSSESRIPIDKFDR